MTELRKLFTGVIDTVKEQCDLKTPLEDKIRLMINSKSLKSPISTRLLPSIDDIHQILAEVSKVLQSNENIPLDESFTIDVVAVGQPTGSGNPLQVLDYTKDTSVKVYYYYWVRR